MTEDFYAKPRLSIWGNNDVSSSSFDPQARSSLNYVVPMSKHSTQVRPSHVGDYRSVPSNAAPPPPQKNPTAAKRWASIDISKDLQRGKCNWILAHRSRARIRSLWHTWLEYSPVWCWPVFRWQWWSHYMFSCVSDDRISIHTKRDDRFI